MAAAARKNEKVTAFPDDPKEPVEEEEEEEETARSRRRGSLRRRRWRARRRRRRRGRRRCTARVEAAEALEATLAAAKPVWPEVEAVLDKTLRSLSLKGKEPLAGAKDGGCPVDPAIWSCVCLFELRIETMPSLTTMPPALSRLSELTTLSSVQPLARCPTSSARSRSCETSRRREPDRGVARRRRRDGDAADGHLSNALADVGGLKELTALVSPKLNSNKLTALPLAGAARAPARPRRRAT